MAPMRAEQQLIVAIFPWGDVIEEFLEPIGLRLEDFILRMTGGWLFGYVAALRSVGHRAIIVCASEAVDSGKCYVHTETSAPIWIVPGRRIKEGRSAAVYSVKRWLATPLGHFRYVLAKEQCSAVIVQEYEYTRFDALVRLARRMNIPVYATFQGGDRSLSWIEALARRISLRNSDGVIVASAEERARLRQTYPWLDRKVIDIPNPVDALVWRPLDRDEARASLGLPTEVFIAINHGRIDIHRKGLDVLLQAWARMPDQDRIELIIIGSGQDRVAFAELLTGSGLTNVRWFSEYTTDRNLIRRWLSAADVYVTASRIEGMPIAPLEAMACGLPIVASDAQGLPDILADREASGGLIVRRDHAEEIEEALCRLRRDVALRTRLGIAARQRIERKFAVPAVGAALASLLGGRLDDIRR
jgi:starch synthase